MWFSITPMHCPCQVKTHTLLTHEPSGGNGVSEGHRPRQNPHRALCPAGTMATLPVGGLPGTAGYPLQWTPHLQGLLCGRPHTSGDPPPRQTPHRCEGGALDSVPLGLRAAVMGVRQPKLSSCANWSQMGEGCPRGHPQARASAGTQDVRGPRAQHRREAQPALRRPALCRPPTLPTSRLSPALGQPGVGPASPLPRWPRELTRQWCQPVSTGALSVSVLEPVPRPPCKGRPGLRRGANRSLEQRRT